MNSIATLDPSLTSTGLCIGTCAADWSCTAIKSDGHGDNVSERMKRCESIIEIITGLLDAAQPSLILVEAYSYASKFGQPAYRHELGGLLRWHLLDYTPHVIEVAPTTLKKFVIGKGAGDKALMQAHIERRWGQIFKTDDQADAFGLFQMALCISGLQEPATEPQREAVAKAVSGHSATARLIAEYCTNHVKPF